MALHRRHPWSADLRRPSPALSNTVSLVVIVVVILWPALHMFAVRHLAINPWEFGGWGMYSVPERFWILDLVEVDGRQLVVDDLYILALPRGCGIW